MSKWAEGRTPEGVKRTNDRNKFNQRARIILAQRHPEEYEAIRAALRAAAAEPPPTP